jgi:hypothetical protein
MNNIYLIKDYRGAFYSSVTNIKTYYSMDINLLKDHFETKGWSVHILEYPDIDFSQNWRGQIVLYQSSEDLGLEYKSYIENNIFGLKLRGAILIPDFQFLYAHHNKVFMEILRKVSNISEANTLRSWLLGTYEDFQHRINQIPLPVVAKPSAGAISKGVVLLKNKKQALYEVQKMTFCTSVVRTCYEYYKRFMYKSYIPYSLNRRKFILQEFVPELQEDYKILFYGNHAYVVRRGVRKNDFRASGSGLLTWPELLPDGMLDTAWKIFKGFDVPFISIDLAYQETKFHLLEVQFIQFGTAALEKSLHHWEYNNGNWNVIRKNSNLEESFVASITQYAQEHHLFQ